MPLELIPVLDLRAGRAVHARGGEREGYAPVRSVLAPGTTGDALALARAFRERVGATRCYVADLDAITGGAPQRALVTRVRAAFGGTLLQDAGLRDAGDLATVDDPALVPVAGTETLADWAALEAMLERRPDLVVSLDLRDGRPLGALAARGDAEAIARGAVARGARELIVLDLARVGRGEGPALASLERVRHAVPGVRLVAGGGVRDGDDLGRLSAAGADGVLVASALHAGALAG